MVSISAGVGIGDRRDLDDGGGCPILREGAGDSRHVVIHVERRHRRIACGSDVGPTRLSTLWS